MTEKTETEKTETDQTDQLNALSDRIDRLESRLMFQDETIETLNQTITAQWREIDALTRQVASMVERLREAEANAPAPSNEPPPHY
jgi:SlyX protein